MTNDRMFKFSIIMSIYKTDQWLREAVDSVIRQDIGFEDNVQIIFVNDGSPDNSERICIEYKERYPDNIVYIKQKNKGLSGARNTGLKYRRGRLVNFFDPDDILANNVLSEVWGFFTQYGEKINFIAIPLVYFEATSGLHPKYKMLGGKNRIVSIIDEPHSFILSSASSFYKTELLNDMKYDETMHGEEDTLFNFRLYKENPRYGYVCEQGVTYWYRRRHDNSSMVNVSAMKPEGYISAIRLLEQVRKFRDEVGDAFDELVIYILRSRLSSIRSDFFSSVKDYEAVLDRMRGVIGLLSHRTINDSVFLTSNDQKYVFLSNIMQRRPVGITNRGEIVFDSHEGGYFAPLVFMKDINMTDTGVAIDIMLQDYNVPSLSLELLSKSASPIKPEKIIKGHSRHSVRYGELTICDSVYYRFVIPYNRTGSYRVSITDGKRRFDSVNLRKPKYSPFVLNSRKIKKWHERQYLKVFDNTFELGTSNPHRILDSLIVTLVLMHRYKRLSLERFLSLGRKRYVLLDDNPEGRGNAEAIFTYIYKKHPDVAKYTYFILDKSSQERRRLEKIGRIVVRGSLKHRFLYLNSRLIMASHLHPELMCPFSDDEYKKYADLISRRFIWLQHGVTKGDVEAITDNKDHEPMGDFESMEYYEGLAESAKGP